MWRWICLVKYNRDNEGLFGGNLPIKGNLLITHPITSDDARYSHQRLASFYFHPTVPELDSCNKIGCKLYLGILIGNICLQKNSSSVVRFKIETNSEHFMKTVEFGTKPYCWNCQNVWASTFTNFIPIFYKGTLLKRRVQ